MTDDSCGSCYDIQTWHKFIQTRNREANTRAKAALELVHTDLAGPTDSVTNDGFRYALAFTDDCSGTVFVHFLKGKSDNVIATEI